MMPEGCALILVVVWMSSSCRSGAFHLWQKAKHSLYDFCVCVLQSSWRLLSADPLKHQTWQMCFLQVTVTQNLFMSILLHMSALLFLMGDERCQKATKCTAVSSHRQSRCCCCSYIVFYSQESTEQHIPWTFL